MAFSHGTLLPKWFFFAFSTVFFVISGALEYTMYGVFRHDRYCLQVAPHLETISPASGGRPLRTPGTAVAAAGNDGESDAPNGAGLRRVIVSLDWCRGEHV